MLVNTSESLIACLITENKMRRNKKCNSIGCFLFCSFLMFTSCKAQNRTSTMVEELTGKTWIHSHEEDQNGLKAFRTQDFSFPSSRGREGFEFNEDSTFIYYSIAPTDGAQKNKGTWTAKGNEIMVKFQENSSFKKELFFEIEGYKNGLLTIEEKEIIK